MLVRVQPPTLAVKSCRRSLKAKHYAFRMINNLNGENKQLGLFPAHTIKSPMTG